MLWHLQPLADLGKNAGDIGRTGAELRGQTFRLDAQDVRSYAWMNGRYGRESEPDS
jgi:hypothetical protein